MFSLFVWGSIDVKPSLNHLFCGEPMLLNKQHVYTLFKKKISQLFSLPIKLFPRLSKKSSADFSILSHFSLFGGFFKL